MSMETITSRQERVSILGVVQAAFQAMRPHQWIKNTLLFAGLIFTGSFHEGSLVLRACLAFGVFCLLSSAVYLFNDLQDLQRDRAHPMKRHRPLPSGRLPVALAWGLVVLLSAFGLGAALLLDRDFQFGLVTLLYWGMSLGYSLWFKNVVLLDVALIALGFVLRAIAGAVVIDVKISPWLIICTFLLALFLGFGKRRHELILLGENRNRHRQALEEYTKELLDHLLTITVATTIQSYAIYTILSETAQHHPGLWYTLPFVIYGLFRYFYLVHRREEGGTPERLILRDKPILICIALWTAMVIAIMVR